jgi:Flp pilus assembly protein TadG
MKGILTRFVVCSGGSSIIELAVALPVLAMILVGTIDFGRVFYTASACTNAARAGAELGAQGGDAAGMQTAATNSAAQDIGTITPNAVTSCVCTPDNPTNFSYKATPVVCTDACAPGTHRTTFAGVTVSKVFTTSARYPGIPRNLTINRTVTLRVSK